MFRQGPGKQVNVGKTASAGLTVEAGGMEACLARRTKTGTGVKNWVRRAVQLSLRVSGGRGSQYAEDEGDGSIKQSNGGTEFQDKTLTIAMDPRLVAVPDQCCNITTS